MGGDGGQPGRLAGGSGGGVRPPWAPGGRQQHWRRAADLGAGLAAVEEDGQPGSIDQLRWRAAGLGSCIGDYLEKGGICFEGSGMSVDQREEDRVSLDGP